ncbi:Hint domain-containing protein [Psychrobacter sp. I-STPA10]|uniref:Hint domain-containing protein n=1 Tax=Psychrobacter sp. I-STPA10 TaxID=2585769 RepID=UPI001E634AEE|nr:Hint domain-containing protein [Psychrobacter sp. I-STPA10]
MSFVAGTLVHTDKGLVAIQDLKVGDLVLSKPEDGSGQVEYKSVLSTLKSTSKRKLFKVEYFNEAVQQSGEKGLNYLFCTGDHPFYVSREAVTDAAQELKGEWLSAGRLPPGYLTAANGDVIALDDYSFMPVRTLPNYPEGCAYIQNIQDKDLWESGGVIQFVQFSDTGYQYVSLAETPAQFKRKIKTLNWHTSDAKLLINQNNPFMVDPELYKMLNVRLSQDKKPALHSAEIYLTELSKPLILDGKVIQENRIADIKLVEKAIKNVKKYGDATGLSDTSLHEQMENYYDDCPNPFKDYVYNLEVADHHTYFVGHDGLWVHE